MGNSAVHDLAPTSSPPLLGPLASSYSVSQENPEFKNNLSPFSLQLFALAFPYACNNFYLTPPPALLDSYFQELGLYLLFRKYSHTFSFPNVFFFQFFVSCFEELSGWGFLFFVFTFHQQLSSEHGPTQGVASPVLSVFGLTCAHFILSAF